MVIVAQLVRALVCGAGSRGFESHQSPIKKGAICSFFFNTIFYKLDYKQFLAVLKNLCFEFLPANTPYGPQLTFLNF